MSSFPTITEPAMWEWAPQTREIFFSPSWRKIVLLPETHSIESDVGFWWARVHNEDIDLLRRASCDLSAGKREQMEEAFRIRRYDGTWVWLLMQGSVSEQINGAVTKASGLLMDVSRLRVNSRFQFGAQQMSGGSYKAMLEHAPDLILRFDREMFPLYANAVLDKYMPVPRHTLGGESLESLGVDDGHMNFMRRHVEQVYDTGKVVTTVLTCSTPMGELSGDYSFWPEFGETGEVVSVLCQMRDLSELVRSAQSGHLNELRLEALHQLTQMDEAPEDEVLRFVVESMTRLTGSAKGYLFIPEHAGAETGRVEWSESNWNCADHFELAGDRIPDDCRAQRGLPLDAEVPLVLNGNGRDPSLCSFSGKLKVMRLLQTTVREGERLACLAVVCNKSTDYDDADMQQLDLFLRGAWLVLRRREFVQDLQKAKAAAEKANTAKNQFLASVSHELRTPLNGVISMLQLLECSELSAQQLDYVRTAGMSGRALLRIISDILDFSRMEWKKLELFLAPFDIRHTIRTTLEMFQLAAKDRGISLTADLDDSIPSLLVGDEARVRQIVFNLVGNAMKFTERGSIRVECSLLPYKRNGKDCVYFVVHDTGIGIAPELHNAVFEPFMQIGDASARKYPGTGLGLGIVRHLFSLMEGCITVDSQEGEGTSMHCSLPFAVCEKPLPVSDPLPQVDTPPTHMMLDVLVAEDDPVSRFAMQSFLRRAGHRPVCVSNGRQALEALRLHSFHCLMTDIQMPEMGGLELAKCIRAREWRDIIPSDEVKSIVKAGIPEGPRAVRGIPADFIIVAISAHAMVGDRERFLHEGMDFYLSKPIVMNDLLDVLVRISACAMLSAYGLTELVRDKR